ncbi:MAG: proprotein convertase P-domain-containing protein [Planctomycetia bacterium]|nr:proprotein convertase P-domain-containing protein [Planctomycetia bacterium]
MTASPAVRRGPLSLAIEPLEDRCLMSVSPMGEKSWDQEEYLAPLGFDAEVAPEETQASFLGFDSDTTAYFKDVAGPVGDATPTGTSYLLFEHWGGTWSDAEKSPSNTEDDLLCWAGAASNVLAWTGWGIVDGLTNTDDVFGYFQDHWTDQGGLMQFGWDWWFDGTNDSQGWSGWSQEDVQGGGFYPNENFSSLFHSQSNDALALTSIDEYLHNGYGVTLGIYGPGGHAITCWGYNYNPDNPSEYLGLWITDSDDSKNLENAPDRLHYYEVESVAGQWFLQDYYGSDAWYIGTVQALEAREATPVVPDADNEIHGTVWDDADGDGSRDAGEAGVAGQTVYLDDNHNGVRDEGTFVVASANVGKSIPDLTTVTSTLAVAGLSGGITDVNVTLDITHAYTSDLEVYLISPTGARVQLFDGVGADGDNFTDTTLDDEAATSISAAGAPFSGTFRPMGSLADFDGQSANGTWTLEITDNWTQDQGVLKHWSLEVSAAETRVETDAAGGFAIVGLTDGDYRVRAVASEGRSLSLPSGGYYDVSLAGGAVFETADFGLASIAPTDLGTVDFLEVGRLELTQGNHWYSCRAARDGWLTVEMLFADSAEGVQMTLFDAGGSEVALSTGSGDSERVDWSVEAGETYFFRVDVAADAVVADLRVANLVQQEGGSVVIHGTSGDDRLEFAAASRQVTINGVDYAFDPAVVNTFTFDGGEGDDTAVLRGSAGADTLVMRPTTAALSGPGYRVAVTAAETIIVVGAGGADKAYLYDSAGDDSFVATPSCATLSGAGFFNQAEGFRHVYAYATAGGTNKAYLYDSAGNDRFEGTTTCGALYGDTFYNYAKGFRYVYAYATAGGMDRAYLYDSAGNDSFVGKSNYSCLEGRSFCNFAKGFRYVYAYATGGTDKAYLYDSAGNDCFIGKSDYSSFEGQSFYNYAKNFRYVYAYATAGGTDKAYLYDSARNDRLKASGSLAQIYSDRFSVSAVGFDWVQAVSSSGGKNTKAVRSIDFVLKTTGRWTKV